MFRRVRRMTRWTSTLTALLLFASACTGTSSPAPTTATPTTAAPTTTLPTTTAPEPSNGNGTEIERPYSDPEATTGITEDSIRLCMHIAGVAGDFFGNTEDDFGVYWEWKNDQGGIHGRSVEMVFTDDQYTPQGGVQAAEQCAEVEPFLMTGGVGFDTVPAVREWAETNRMIYLSSFAVETDPGTLTFTYSLVSTVEQFGHVAGSFVSSNPQGPVGIVWRNSANWRPGRDAFVAALEATGVEVVADIAVQQGQGEFASIISTLAESGAETVLGWISAPEFLQLAGQSAQQGYFPRWVTAAFNIVPEMLGPAADGSLGPAMVGLWVTPEYHQGATDSYSADEIAVMEEAFRTYRPDKEQLNDVVWQTWLTMKQIDQLLTDCGPDCNRNTLLEMLATGYRADIVPTCGLEFGPDDHIGSSALNVMLATTRDGLTGWEQVETCNEGL
jgi:branched-chain amino acid transport system substrate-binding protein